MATVKVRIVLIGGTESHPLFGRQVSSPLPVTRSSFRRPATRAVRLSRARPRRAPLPAGPRSVSSIVGAPRDAARRDPSATSAATHTLGSEAGSIANRPRMARLTGRNGGSRSATASVADPRSSPRESTATSSDGSPAFARPRWAAMPPTTVASTARGRSKRMSPAARLRAASVDSRSAIASASRGSAIRAPIPCPTTGTVAPSEVTIRWL